MKQRDRWIWSAMFGVVVACGFALCADEPASPTGDKDNVTSDVTEAQVQPNSEPNPASGGVGVEGNAGGNKLAIPPAINVAHQATVRQPLISSLTIFVLAIFLGYLVISKVPPTLHTPLMSGSNAISGITIVGALMVAGVGLGFSSFLGLIAVILATVNAVGGFLVTHRMLSMFRKR